MAFFVSAKVGKGRLSCYVEFFWKNEKHYLKYFVSLLYKTNRFDVGVRLFSNRSQMMSKCGKNKQVAHEIISTDITRKPAFAPPLPTLAHTKSHFSWSIIHTKWAILLVAMGSNELWLVQENHATVKHELSVAPRGMKTYSESRIELRNLQILQKMLEVKSLFAIRAAMWAEKLGRCVTLQELKKYPLKTCGWVQPRGHLIRVLNENRVCGGGNFCLLWLVTLKSVWYNVGDKF